MKKERERPLELGRFSRRTENSENSEEDEPTNLLAGCVRIETSVVL